MFLAVVSASYKEETVPTAIEGEEAQRVVLNIPPFLAPVKVAVLPHVKKDGLPEKALEIFNVLKYHHLCHYEEKDTIGRRYRRMDAIGTPYCITIDHQTLQDNTVTIRERDTMKQDRIPVEDVVKVVGERVKWPG